MPNQSTGDDKSDKQAKAARFISWLALGFSVVSVFISGSYSLGGAAGNMSMSYQNAATAACLSWVSYVTEQQDRAKAAGQQPSEVDERLDRVGNVLLSHSRANSEEVAVAAVKALGRTPSTPAPTPGQDIAEVSIARQCGSAAELRRARDTSAPLDLKY